VTYNPNASHNLTYPNSGKAPADTRWFYVKEPEYTHDEYDRLKIESARKTMETARNMAVRKTLNAWNVTSPRLRRRLQSGMLTPARSALAPSMKAGSARPARRLWHDRFIPHNTERAEGECLCSGQTSASAQSIQRE
jgi:hypothetical protein